MKHDIHMKRLAIVYPKAIGDFMFALPALHTIRQTWKEIHITLVVKRKQAPIALPQKGILADEVLVIGGETSWSDVRRELNALNVDTVIDMAGNDHAGLIMSCRRGRRIRPHRSDCKGMCAIYSPFAEAMPKLPVGLHRVDELLTFARYLGAQDPIYSFALKLPDRAIEESEKMIAKHGLQPGSVVALNLGASRDSKCWPAEHFRTLAEGLIANGHRVALMGAHAFKPDNHYDRRLVEQFTREGLVNGETCIDLTTDATLPADVHLQRDTHFLRYSKIPKLVVGNDTGPLHLAGSVGDDAQNKTLSLFGPTNWGRYAPYDQTRLFPDTPQGEWNHVFCADVDCGPVGTEEACRCYRSKCSHKKCMHELRAETVLKGALAMVETT
ncbi:MAG: glycosyltransferase family 9 protein [Verrucomicrobia bacterium]|jgi:ADP-heptose:LPS heptosyltransferase|nr:glycosyltransferase family 9 protein [Verrucomicrobiota bacterium]